MGPGGIAHRALIAAGSSLAALTVVDAVLVGMPGSNLLAVNTAGTMLHAILAAVALVVATRRRAPAGDLPQSLP